MSSFGYSAGEDKDATIDPRVLQNTDISANDFSNLEQFLPSANNDPLDTSPSYPPVEPIAVCIITTLPLSIRSHEAHGF
jgi:hypothetical protein